MKKDSGSSNGSITDKDVYYFIVGRIPMSIEICQYLPPHGEVKRTKIITMRIQDENFFKCNDLNLSMEYIPTGDLILYSTTGIVDEEGEEIESCYCIYKSNLNAEGISKAFEHLANSVKEINPKLITYDLEKLNECSKFTRTE